MKPTRDSIVSIRITDDEMVRLRAKATARRISVSELLRRAALDEPAPFPPGPGELTQTSVSSYAAIISADPRVQGGGTFGVIWTDVPDGTQVNGSTITLTVPKGTPPPSNPPKTNPPPGKPGAPPANPKR